MEELDAFQIQEWEAVPVDEAVKSATKKVEGEQERKRRGGRWIITSGIKPVDLYVYLKARFGTPNGLTMLVKNWNDSDNIIHWHYSLRCSLGRIEIFCFNFRIEVWHPFGGSDAAGADFLAAIKADFARLSQRLGEVRKGLEKWQVFLNPYMRLKNMIEELMEELEALALDSIETPAHPHVAEELEGFKERFSDTAKKFSRAARICLSVRMLAPVWAESFVNLILFVLARPDVRNDGRLYESLVRQPIDIRIKSLHLNCEGFEMAVPYDEWEACKKFHSLMMGRNNMLHGNVDPRLTTFDEVYFDYRTPLFIEFHDFAFFSYKAALHEASPEQAIDDYQTVQDLVAHILICMSSQVQEEFRTLLLKRDLGWDAFRQRVGILFPDYSVDFVPVFAAKEKPESAP